MDYYQETEKKIKKLVDEKKADKALEILKEELNMPYIPKEYDDKYNKLLNEVMEIKRLEQDSLSLTMSNEEISNVIKNESDFDTLVESLFYLEGRNVRNFFEELKGFLIKTSNNSVVKTIILNILIDQEVDIEIEVHKND